MDDYDRWRVRMKAKGIDVDTPLGPVTPEQIAALAAQGLYPQTIILTPDGPIVTVDETEH